MWSSRSTRPSFTKTYLGARKVRRGGGGEMSRAAPCPVTLGPNAHWGRCLGAYSPPNVTCIVPSTSIHTTASALLQASTPLRAAAAWV